MDLFLSVVSPWFDWLARSTVQISLLIVIIVALVAAWPSRLPVLWRHALWLVLMLRMITPWAPASRMSVFNWVPMSHTDRSHSPAEALPAPARFGLPEDAFGPLDGSPAGTGATIERSSSHIAAAAADHSMTTREVLLVIWIAGAAALAALILATNILLMLRVRRARPVTNTEALELLADAMTTMGLRTVPALLQTRRITGPVLVGWLRPRLYVPEGMIKAFDRDQLRHIFLHELAHLKRHDILVGWLAAALQVVHWFNPLVWLAFHRMRTDRELACDALVLSRLRPGEPRRYAETIINLVERYSRSIRGPVVVGIFDSKMELTRRIVMINRFRGSSAPWSMLGLALVVCLGCVALTDARSESTGTAPAVPAA